MTLTALDLGCVFPDVDLAEATAASTGMATASSSSASGSSAESSSTITASSSSTAGGGGDGGASPGAGGGGGGAGGGGGGPPSTSSSAGGGGGAVPPLLGLADSFAVLGGSTVTNVGLTSITGDLGLSPGTSITGIPPGMPIGTNHEGGPVADQAQFDATMASNALMVEPCDVTHPTAALGGLTLGPGIHCFEAAAIHLAGQLILDAGGDADARFVFRIGAALTTGPFASISTIDGASACNVIWLVGTSATVGEGSLFEGTILARSAITLEPGVTLTGRAIAREAALSLSSNSISVASCVP